MASFTSAQLDALAEAYATGALTVEYDGKRVTYRSAAEIERAIGIVSAALGVTSPLTPTVSRNRIGLASFTRG
jgi:hypothetical protein